jgi:hypothetical protein
MLGGRTRTGTDAGRLRGRLLASLCCLLAAAALANAAAAGATTAPSAAGTWSCCGAGGAGEQTWTITESSGTLSGSGPGIGPIHGSISGTSVTIVTGPYTSDPGYEATFVGTISGETMSGTWKSNASQEGTWTATRTSGSPTVKTKQEEEQEATEVAAKKKKEEEEKAGKRKSAIQVNCDAFYPGLPSEYFQCTAQVGDASGQSPAAIPTGTVEFTINPGGGGAILGSKTCTLAPSQTGGASSFCAIDYLPPTGGIAIGSQPPLIASYSGSSIFNPLSGGATGPLSATNPLSPTSVFDSLCVATFIPACAGVTAPPKALSDGCLSLVEPLAKDSSAAEGCPADAAGQTVTLALDEPALTLDATCPPSSDDLTNCELQAYVEGKSFDPAIKAKLEYELNYTTYLGELAQERAVTLQAVKDFLTSNDRVAPDATPEDRANILRQLGEFSDHLLPGLEKLYDQLAKRGGDIPAGTGTYDPAEIKKFCEVSNLSTSGCETVLAAVNDIVSGSAAKLSKSKMSLGVNVPFTPPPAKAQSASASAVHDAAKRRAHNMVYASSKTVTVPAGKTAKLRLAIPAFVRARLKYALARHETKLKASLVVSLTTSTGASARRTIPVTIKLVAKHARRLAKKK